MKKSENKNLKNERLNNSSLPVLDEELAESELDMVNGGTGHYFGQATTGTSASSVLKKLDDTVGGQQQKIG